MTLGVGAAGHIVACSSLNCGQHGRDQYLASCHNHAVAAVLMRWISVARLAAAAAGLTAGLGTLAIAGGLERHTTYAEDSVLATTLTLAAGTALIIAGLISCFLGPAA